MPNITHFQIEAGQHHRFHIEIAKRRRNGGGVGGEEVGGVRTQRIIFDASVLFVHLGQVNHLEVNVVLCRFAELAKDEVEKLMFFSLQMLMASGLVFFESLLLSFFVVFLQTCPLGPFLR